MISRDAPVDGGSLRDRPVARADMVFRLTAHDGAVRLVARDASTGQFAGLSVRSATRHLPGIADDAAIDLFSLSPDGSRLLFGDPDIGRARLSLHALATSAGVTLPPGPGDGANAARARPRREPDRRADARRRQGDGDRPGRRGRATPRAVVDRG